NEIGQNAVHLAAFDQESIVADGGGQLGHGQQVAQVARDMFLLVIRVQNIGIYADDHGGYLRRSQSFVEPAAAAANIVPVKRFGQRHVRACIETLRQLGSLVIQIG